MKSENPLVIECSPASDITTTLSISHTGLGESLTGVVTGTSTLGTVFDFGAFFSATTSSTCFGVLVFFGGSTGATS
jgi:hypothetical protein